MEQCRTCKRLFKELEQPFQDCRDCDVAKNRRVSAAMGLSPKPVLDVMLDFYTNVSTGGSDERA